MRSPSKVPAATRSVCGNIYTGVACTRPSLRPCTPLHGSRSPPRFLKIYREISDQLNRTYICLRIIKFLPVSSLSAETIMSNKIKDQQFLTRENTEDLNAI